MIPLKKLLIISLLIRLLIIPFFYHPDIKSQYFHFQFLSKGVTNVYQYIYENKSLLPYRDTFNYLPLTYFTFGSYFALIKPITLPSISAWLDDWGYFQNSYPNLPFFLIYLKLPYLFADYLIGFLLFKIYQRREVLYLWLLNPISIYLIYILGNFDIIPTLLTVLSYYFLSKNQQFKSFIFLGLAIALKMYPLIFLPFFLFSKNTKPKQIILNTVTTFIPLLLTTLPFIYNPSFLSSFLGSGLTQKVLEHRFFGIPIFPVGYSLIFLSFISKKSQLMSSNLKLETHFLYLFVLFISTVNFHPQWLLWFFPYILGLYYFQPKIRKYLIFTFILLFIYIALFNDHYLFWGHFTPIDTSFINVITPYQLIIKFFPIKPESIQNFLRFIFFFTFVFYILRHRKNAEI